MDCLTGGGEAFVSSRTQQYLRKRGTLWSLCVISHKGRIAEELKKEYLRGDGRIKRLLRVVGSFSTFSDPPIHLKTSAMVNNNNYRGITLPIIPQLRAADLRLAVVSEGWYVDRKRETNVLLLHHHQDHQL